MFAFAFVLSPVYIRPRWTNINKLQGASAVVLLCSFLQGAKSVN